MKYYFAPMEGITGYIVRNAYHHNFGDIDRYFTPFIPAGKKMNKRVIRDLLPENNAGIHLIPQLMSNNAADVLDNCESLREYGYSTVNINLGCPSGTVAHKGRGAGFLNYPEELDAFLYQIFEKTDFKISLKTRVGVESMDGWERLLTIYAKYPLEELIIHPRLQKDFYKNPLHMDAFQMAVDIVKDIPLCYNGDLVNLEGIRHFASSYPGVNRVMIGRGLLANPGLIVQAKNADRAREASQSLPPASAISSSGSGTYSTAFDADTYKKKLRSWHDEILSGYLSIFTGERDAVFHMKEIWLYLYRSFSDSDKYLKKIKKSQNLQEDQKSVV